MSFNTLEGGITCPFCKSEILSGIGFRLGKIAGSRYKIGDQLDWEGGDCRPKRRPSVSTIKTIGYFNCDNVTCYSWKDCYPDVQLALITVEDNVITGVELYKGKEPKKQFAILEPASLKSQ